MIENNPSNVSSGFEMLLEEVEAEIDFYTRIGSRAFESRDFRKVDEARTQADPLPVPSTRLQPFLAADPLDPLAVVRPSLSAQARHDP